MWQSHIPLSQQTLNEELRNTSHQNNSLSGDGLTVYVYMAGREPGHCSSGLRTNDMEAIELRKHTSNHLTIVVDTTGIVGLLECLVRLAASHVPKILSAGAPYSKKKA